MTKKPLIVIIEDDDWLASHHKRLLEADGYRTSVVNNALDAIDRLDDEKPAAIILDIWLPGPNGIALLHEMQSHKDLAGIPVVLCTSAAEAVKGVNLAAYGVRKVIDKNTMELDSLVVAVRELV